MLGRLFERPREERATQTWWNQAGIPGLISAAAYGNQPNVEQALSNAASWACIDVLVDIISRTPWDAVRPQGDSRIPITPTPLVLRRPSPLLGITAWKRQLAFEMVTDGNTFGLIVDMSRGLPTQIEILSSGDVTERKVKNGRAQVKYQNETHELYPFGDILHMPGRVMRGGSPFGLSPAAYASPSIAMSVAALQYGSKFFSEDAIPALAVYSDSELTTDQVKDAKEMVRRLRWGGEAAVMGSGSKLEALNSDPAKTQFLDVLRFAIEEACRFWRVPPSMAYAAVSGQSVTYANVTQADLSLLKHSADGYFVSIEGQDGQEGMSVCLPSPQVVKFNRNAILRGDAAMRFDIYDRRLRNKTISVNQVHLLEDETPVDDPEYDKPGIPGIPNPPPAAKDPPIPLGEGN